jgi:hypothetical protein
VKDEPLKGGAVDRRSCKREELLKGGAVEGRSCWREEQPATKRKRSSEEWGKWQHTWHASKGMAGGRRARGVPSGCTWHDTHLVVSLGGALESTVRRGKCDEVDSFTGTGHRRINETIQEKLIDGRKRHARERATAEKGGVEMLVKRKLQGRARRVTHLVSLDCTTSKKGCKYMAVSTSTRSENCCKWLCSVLKARRRGVSNWKWSEEGGASRGTKREGAGGIRTCRGISRWKRASEAHLRFNRITERTLWISPFTQLTALETAMLGPTTLQCKVAQLPPSNAL